MKTLNPSLSLTTLAFGALMLAASAVQAGSYHDRGFKHGSAVHQSTQFIQQINERQARQMRRIEVAKRQGALDPRSYRSLMREQADIRALEKRHMRDGRLDPFEFRQLSAALDVAGRNIRASTHDRHARSSYGVRGWYN